jgi:hypothetical protein
MSPETRAFEYALGLYSVLVGLAIADIANSLHRLLRHRRGVRWDPLVLFATGFALLIAIGMWFDLWGVRNVASTRHFFFYLLIVALLFLVFLVAAASLPDEHAGAVDLREFYEGNRSYFWTLVALFQVTYFLMGYYFTGSLLPPGPASLRITFGTHLALLTLLPLVLARVRSRAFHYLAQVLLYVALAWHYSQYSIG